MRNRLNPVSVKDGQLEERRLGRPKQGLSVRTVLIATALEGSVWFPLLLSGDEAGLWLAGLWSFGLAGLCFGWDFWCLALGSLTVRLRLWTPFWADCGLTDEVWNVKILASTFLKRILFMQHFLNATITLTRVFVTGPCLWNLSYIFSQTYNFFELNFSETVTVHFIQTFRAPDQPFNGLFAQDRSIAFVMFQKFRTRRRSDGNESTAQRGINDPEEKLSWKFSNAITDWRRLLRNRPTAFFVTLFL